MNKYSIGIAGLGTVGIGVIQGLIKNNSELTIRTGVKLDIIAVSARSERDRGIDLSPYKWFSDPCEMAKSNDIDIFVEVMGGSIGSALDSVKIALKTGKIVVTANKAMLAEYGEELAKLAENNNTYIYYEAAISGGIPAVKALREGMVGNKVNSVYGILNGTCNYILTTIEKTGRDFEDVLAESQKLGYAEDDPSFDVDGFDAGQKLSLLASIAFGINGAYNEMHIETITNCISNDDVSLAGKMGYTPRLVGVAKNNENGILLYMAPALVSKSATFGRVDDVTNAVIYSGDMVGDISLTGAGAGRSATASAIIADIADIVRGGKMAMYNQPVSSLTKAKILPMEYRCGRYYISVTAQVDTLKDVLNSNDIVIERKLLDNKLSGFIIKQVNEAKINQAVAGIDATIIRIEDC